MNYPQHLYNSGVFLLSFDSTPDSITKYKDSFCRSVLECLYPQVSFKKNKRINFVYASLPSIQARTVNTSHWVKLPSGCCISTVLMPQLLCLAGRVFVCSSKSPKPSAAHLDLSFTAFNWLLGSGLINIFHL